MKSIISAAVITTAIVASISLHVEAKSLNHVPASLALSDTGKMASSKMSKMAKKEKMEKKKMSKMGKMDKMAKDTGKMASKM